MAAHRKTIPEAIAERIRGKILRGSIAPGERLSEYSFCRSLRTGQPTVREAFFILAQQGLVKRVAHTGTFVTRLEAREVRNLLQIRAELEVLAVGLAAAGPREEDLAELRRHADGIRQSAPARNRGAYLQADMAFHRKVWEMAGNEQLSGILESIVVPLLACAFQSWERTAAEIEDTARAHLVIVESLRAGPVAARKAMRRHIERFLQLYLSRTLGISRHGG
jgi:DNA-binding GntR family transcriptional regulator